jgi:hypothetical protein
MAISVFAFDDVAFERRLAETISWCASRARGDEPRRSLRSESLSPSVLAVNRASCVRSVVASRSGLVRDVGQRLVGRPSLLGGRLLVYFPDADLADGAAEVQSRGFFDVHNVPPWDTWIALARETGTRADASYGEYIVAWVPPALLELAQAGISVNPEECIAWLDDADVSAREELGSFLR